jgi:hypothetical protein
MTTNLDSTDTTTAYTNAKKAQSSLVRNIVSMWEEDRGEELADMTYDPLCDVAKWYLGDAVSYLRELANGPVVTEEMVDIVSERTSDPSEEWAIRIAFTNPEHIAHIADGLDAIVNSY